MTQHHYDLVIIGGGTAGVIAALEGAKCRLSTALIEPAFLGGTCLNTGCVPTKYLLAATASLPLAQRGVQNNYVTTLPTFNFVTLQQNKSAHILRHRNKLAQQLAERKVTVFKSKGTFYDEHVIECQFENNNVLLSFDKAIVATGSTPASFPGIEADGKNVLSPAGLLASKQPPESLILIGGGAIGLEMGEFFSRFGTKIIMVEQAAELLSNEEPETRAIIHEYLLQNGWELHLGKGVSNIISQAGRAILTFNDGSVIDAEKALIAVGRRPANQTLQIEKAKLERTPRGWLATDEYLRCSKHIYCIGDANGRVLLANAAIAQAKYVVNHLNKKTSESYSANKIPACIYGSLEIMRVGPTEDSLRKAGSSPSSFQVPLSDNHLSQGWGFPEGFIKIVHEGNIVKSISAVGYNVSHLATAAAVLIDASTCTTPLQETVFLHPSLEEALSHATNLFSY